MKSAVVLASTLLLLAFGTAGAQQKKQSTRQPPLTPQQEAEMRAKHPVEPPKASFYVQPTNENPGNFTILLSDANNRAVSGNFRTAQLDVFEAVLTESIKFAETDEDTGKTTRFADKTEKGLIVDVQKTQRESIFFVTISYLGSKLTIDSGVIVRGDKRERKVLAIDLLKAIKEVKTSS